MSIDPVTKFMLKEWSTDIGVRLNIIVQDTRQEKSIVKANMSFWKKAEYQEMTVKPSFGCFKEKHVRAWMRGEALGRNRWPVTYRYEQQKASIQGPLLIVSDVDMPKTKTGKTTSSTEIWENINDI